MENQAGPHTARVQIMTLYGCWERVQARWLFAPTPKVLRGKSQRKETTDKKDQRNTIKNSNFIKKCQSYILYTNACNKFVNTAGFVSKFYGCFLFPSREHNLGGTHHNKHTPLPVLLTLWRQKLTTGDAKRHVAKTKFH
jgi:hypothetical protein